MLSAARESHSRYKLYLAQQNEADQEATRKRRLATEDKQKNKDKLDELVKERKRLEKELKDGKDLNKQAQEKLDRAIKYDRKVDQIAALSLLRSGQDMINSSTDQMAKVNASIASLSAKKAKQ